MTTTQKTSAQKTSDSVMRHVARTVSSWRRGRRPDAEELLRQFPEIRQDKQLALDVAYEMYCLLRARGETDLAAKLCRRFPTYATSVARFIEVHELMEEFCPAPQDVTWPEVGDDFLHYKLTAELGRGGLARVYQARHSGMGGRLAALKISPYGGDAEAGTLGRLQHCGIAPGVTIERDEESGLTAIVMEYKGWATLVELLDHGFADGLPESVETIYKVAFDPALADREEPRLLSGSYVEGVIELGVQIAKALQYAHNNNVLHGDLKPSNVLVTPWGQALLLDFNLSADAELASMRIGGTLPYCAPERLEQLFLSPSGSVPQSPRESHAQQAELFSLGVMLYEVLTGHYPYDLPDHAERAEEAAAALIQRQQTRPTRAHKWNPQADEALSEILDRCLAPCPADRPESAKQLAEELEGWLAQKRRAETAAAEEKRRVAARKRAERVFTGGLIAVVAGFALVASISGSSWRNDSPPPAADLAADTQESADTRELGELAEEYANVRRLLADGKREEAKGLLKRIYESGKYGDSETVDARMGYAVLEIEDNPQQRLQLLPHFWEAHSLAPANDPIVCTNLGIQLSRKLIGQDPGLAFVLLSRALRGDDPPWQAAFVRARMTLNEQRVDPAAAAAAAADMDRAVEHAPDVAFDYLMHRDAASIYYQAAKVDAVQRHLHRACELGIAKAQFRRCSVSDDVRATTWYCELLEKCQDGEGEAPRRCLLILPKDFCTDSSQRHVD